MRMLTAILIAGFAAPAFAASLDDADAPVMPDTPSGTGDPAAIVCRAPQALPNGALGPKICMHNAVWMRLTLTGKDLSPDGASVSLRPTVMDPTGGSHSDAVTCRRPAQITASRTRRGPEVCLTNHNWADLAAHQKRVDADGQIVSTRNTGPVGDGAFPIATTNSSPPL